MRRVRSTDTTPEKRVRSLLHKLGYRFRLYRSTLPGKPDIILPKHRVVIFVHGCFWHRHQGCPHATTPASRQEYWLPKFKRTVERDKKNEEELCRSGWNVTVIWECETNDLPRLAANLLKLMGRVQSFTPHGQAELAAMAAEPQEEYLP
jgi:DNA mismatch endonuclease (patch repair protein)